MSRNVPLHQQPLLGAMIASLPTEKRLDALRAEGKSRAMASAPGVGEGVRLRIGIPSSRDLWSPIA
jgi:hypothetical protein